MVANSARLYGCNRTTLEPYTSSCAWIQRASANPSPPPRFSVEKESEFYKQAYQVYQVG